MYMGFHQDPKRTEFARLVALTTAWFVLTAFAVVLFIQTFYQSRGARIPLGIVVAGMVFLPIYSKMRGRALISPPPSTGSEVSRRTYPPAG
jgi:hypothetical protein